jgi:transcriptional regulator with XRE-family HTH domain/predicted ATPase
MSEAAYRSSLPPRGSITAPSTGIYLPNLVGASKYSSWRNLGEILVWRSDFSMSSKLSSGTVRSNGPKIAGLRLDRGWSQEKFAEVCGVTKRTIQRIEKGEPAYAATLLIVANKLNVNLEEIISPTPLPFSYPISLPRRYIVGRKEERSQLSNGLQAVVAGQSRILCVVGEPGIGKTALVSDFLQELTSDSYYIAQGRCSERLAGTEAYLPILEALENILRIDNQVADQMQKIAPTWYLQLAPRTAGPVAALEPSILAVSQERLKREISAFFHSISIERPLVIFFDDLHWADVSTVELINYLASKFDSIRILILVSYRPLEMITTNNPFAQIKLDLQTRNLCEDIELDFLTQGDIIDYIAHEFPSNDFPANLPKMIHTQTEGNPLFMIDLLRYFRDRGVIVETKGRWELIHAFSDIELGLPQSIRAMIQRKIGQLSEEDRDILIIASVQGFEFDSAIISQALDRDIVEIEERLKALDNVFDFVRYVCIKEFPDLTQTLHYRFVHVLYQNALYSSLQLTRKASLSGDLATSLLNHYGKKSEVVASELAYLFEAARDNEQATNYYILAAQNALGIFAYQEAIKLSFRGLKLITKPSPSDGQVDQEIRLQNILGAASMALKGYSAPEVENAFSRARELCQRVKDSPQIFRVLRGLGGFYCNRAKLDTALELGNQLLRMAQDQQSDSQMVEALSLQGLVLFFMGDFDSALTGFKRAQTLIERQALKIHAIPYTIHIGVLCLAAGGDILWKLGYPDQALNSSDQAISVAQQSSHQFSIAYSLIWSGGLHARRGEWELSREKLDRSIWLSQQNGFLNWLVLGLILKGHTSFMQGERGRGIELMQEGLAGITKMGADIDKPFYLLMLSEALGLNGQVEEGLDLINDAITIINTTSEHNLYSEVYRIKGELLLMRHVARGGSQPAAANESTQNEADQLGLEEAEICFRRAIEKSQAQRAKSFELRAVSSYSKLLRLQGKKSEAQEMLSEIYVWFTEGLDTMDLKKAAMLIEELT